MKRVRDRKKFLFLLGMILFTLVFWFWSTAPVNAEDNIIIPWPISYYYVAPPPLGDDVNNSGTHPASPFATIQHAVDVADGSVLNPVVVRVAAGTYHESISMDSDSSPVDSWESLEGGWASDFSQRWDFSGGDYQPPAAFETIIYGDETNHCLDLYYVEGMSIDGFTFENCLYGIYADEGSPVVKNSYFYRNGTGVTIHYPGGNCIISHCAFIENGDGRAIYLFLNYPMITDCLFVKNSSAGDGGAILYGDSAGQLRNSWFYRNEANRDGGAVACDFDCPSIVNNYFVKNYAKGSGGAVSIWDSPLQITNSVFYNNRTLDKGGAIANQSDVSGTIANSTFSENQARLGGAIFNGPYSLISLHNSILWGDKAITGKEIANDFVSGGGVAGELFISYNDIMGGIGGIVSNPVSGVVDGGGNIASNPMFVNASQGNLRLLPHSPCIDAGDNVEVPPDDADLDNDGNTSEPTPIDIGGNLRFIDDPYTADTGNGAAPIVDMGAFEFESRDSDRDGIPDGEDRCPVSDLRDTVIIDGWDSGVENVLLENGCTISDLIALYADDAGNPGELLSSAALTINDLKKSGIISGKERVLIQLRAAQADLP